MTREKRNNDIAEYPDDFDGPVAAPSPEDIPPTQQEAPVPVKIEEVPFNTLPLHPLILKKAAELGYVNATPIQAAAIPLAVQNHDVVGQSGTGSGKTVTFGLPILQRVTPRYGIQALILTPTRELCVQIAEVMTVFGTLFDLQVTTVYGGVGMEPQIEALRNADIVVATPGRTLDHLSHKTIDFKNVRFLVLDEADKMFEMGFYEDVEEIIRHIPKQRQTMLFTATLNGKVTRLMQKYLYQPEIVRIHEYADPHDLKQSFYDVRPNEKFGLLTHLLRMRAPGLAIVFCAARYEVDLVADNLKRQGIPAAAIHGGIEQSKRLKAIVQMREQNMDILVATDVAACGLDIKNVTHIYNWSLPKTSEEYIHRIGRTARAGASGDAITILSPDDHENFRRILSDHSLTVDKLPIPPFPKLPFVRAERRDRGFGPPREGGREGGFGMRRGPMRGPPRGMHSRR